MYYIIRFYETKVYYHILDTLGVIVRTIGSNGKNDKTVAIALRALKCGMNLLKEIDDPDLKKSVYGLFASVSMVMQKEMDFALSPIVEQMISSIKSSEGVVVSNKKISMEIRNNTFLTTECIICIFFQTHYKDNEDAAFPIYELVGNSESEGEEDIENTDNEDDADDDDIAGFSVENAYIEEKEEAILALKEIAEYTE